MTSARQLEANRQNARRSTGPTTVNGKARVAKNALTHGLLSQDTLLPDEDPQLLQTLADALRTEWNPEGAREHLLVDMMIRAAWRLGRLARVEAGVFAWERFGILAERAGQAARTYERGGLAAFSEQNGRPTITDSEKHQTAMTQAKHLRGLREESPAATLGLTFIRGSSGVDAFSKLSRYEAAIERSYYRALHELQRLQHGRLGGHVPLPVAIDVTVNHGKDGDADHPAGHHPEGGLAVKPKKINPAKQSQIEESPKSPNIASRSRVPPHPGRPLER